MLQVSKVSKAFGDNVILDDVSFVVNRGERVGLAGPNGCGKTTLLRIIVGEEQPDLGYVRLSPADVSVGYLAQALDFETGATVGDVMRQGAADWREAERQVETLAQQMAAAQGDELPGLMDQYSRALSRFEAAGGYGAESEIDAILAKLDLGHVGQSTPVRKLSGGQKTRLGLARLLHGAPQLLLLDEPSNHLDIAGLEWLERFLDAYAGAVLIVSHDRTLLDNTVHKVLELDGATHAVTPYPGNYTEYWQARLREREKQWADHKDQQQRFARMEGVIRGLSGHARRIERGTTHYHYRKIAKGLARQSVVQKRRLERLLSSEERIEKPGRTWQMKLSFEAAPASGKDVLLLEDLSLGYQDRALLSNVRLVLRQGERIALVGPNGSGKTTLLRGIVGDLPPLTGQIRRGTNVRLGYYSQEQEGLDEASTPLDEIRRVVPVGETEVRSFLHYFLFSGDEVFAQVRNLSLGERARLALAKLVASGCNLLLLDEPVNYLDIPSRERFELGLSAFEGTVVAVVHDRYFIERFATGLWSVEGNTVRRYLDLSDLRRARCTRGG